MFLRTRCGVYRGCGWLCYSAVGLKDDFYWPYHGLRSDGPFDRDALHIRVKELIVAGMDKVMRVLPSLHNTCGTNLYIDIGLNTSGVRRETAEGTHCSVIFLDASAKALVTHVRNSRSDAAPTDGSFFRNPPSTTYYYMGLKGLANVQWHVTTFGMETSMLEGICNVNIYYPDYWARRGSDRMMTYSGDIGHWLKEFTVSGLSYARDYNTGMATHVAATSKFVEFTSKVHENKEMHAPLTSRIEVSHMYDAPNIDSRCNTHVGPRTYVRLFRGARPPLWCNNGPLTNVTMICIPTRRVYGYVPSDRRVYMFTGFDVCDNLRWGPSWLALITQIGGQPCMLDELVAISVNVLEGTLHQQEAACAYPVETRLTELGFILFPTDLLWQWVSTITRLHFGYALSLMKHYLDRLEADASANTPRVLHPQGNGEFGHVFCEYMHTPVCI